MFKLHLKIAFRNLSRNYLISLINMGGLGIALAAFILIVMYVDYETSYDKSNPNYENIYVVGRDLTDYKTNLTPPPLAKLIEQYCPEVELVGKMKPASFGFALISEKGRVYSKNSLVVDYNAAQMFNLRPQNGLKRPAGKDERLFYLEESSMRILFPSKKDNMPELVTIGSKAVGITNSVHGTIVSDPHSNIKFDALAVANEIGDEEGFGYPNYYTYIQVKAGANIKDLEGKIDRLLKGGMIKENGQASVDHKKQVIFLDPLSNLHLRPMAGNSTNYKIVMVLFFLSVVIVVIACINFTNLTIAQANKRAKEVGVKKVLGSKRYMLTFQFLFEILIQCMVSVIIGVILTELLLPAFNNLFGVPLSFSHVINDLYWILPALLVGITFIAGIYPALILSGFKPVQVLKGNFQTSTESQWLRKALLVVQFAIAVVFLTGISIVSTQVDYMHTEDTGFNTSQVVVIKNLSIFNKPAVFSPLREKMLKIEGIESVTVSSDVPDGSDVGSNSYTMEGKEILMDIIDVDFDYFETLGIKVKSGRTFSEAYKSDTLNSVVLNESAVAKFGLKDAIGKTVRGCHMDYKVVGVIRDFKSQGFEHPVQPTIYAMNNPCGNPRLNIMVKISGAQMGNVLSTLKKQWPSINKLDGEDFRYDFLDELYGRLSRKQEQLKSVFFISALLTVFIAVMGLFAFSKFMTTNRSKEIAVRRILGASNFQVIWLLNTSFLWMLLISNLIAWPLVYALANSWLATFAYRIEISLLPFALAALITFLLTVITVSIQALKAVYENPADILKYE